MKGYYELKRGEQLTDLSAYIHEISYYRYNWHSQIELDIVLRGEIEFSIDGELHHLYENDVVVINSNVGHASRAVQPGSKDIVLRFEPTIFKLFSPNYKSFRFLCRSDVSSRENENFKKIRYFTAMILESFSRNSMTSLLSVEAYFKLLITVLVDDFMIGEGEPEKTFTDIHHQAMVKKILDYLEENYRQVITLDEIAKIAKYNRTYISHVFKKTVGINFYEYLSWIRFRHALHELITTDKTLTRIAADNGFPDLKPFSIRFREMFKVSPSSYRTQISSDWPSASEVVNFRHYLPVSSEDNQEQLRYYINYMDNPSGSKQQRMEKLEYLEKQKVEALQICRKLFACLNNDGISSNSSK